MPNCARRRRAELARAGQPHTLAPPDLVPSGETRDIHRAGGRYLTLVGTNSLFHLPQDRWPDAVDAAAIARHRRRRFAARVGTGSGLIGRGAPPRTTGVAIVPAIRQTVTNR